MPPRQPAGRTKQPPKAIGQPAGQARRVRTPVRVQSGEPYEQKLATLVALTIVNPVLERLEQLEAEFALREPGVVYRAILDVAPTRRSGTARVTANFGAAAIGAPVIVTADPPAHFDGAEFVIPSFVGKIVDEHTMMVAFNSASPIGTPASIVYIIGRS